MPFITSGSFDTRAMQWMIIACTLMAAWAILVDYADATEREAANSLDEIAVTGNSEAATDNLSYNSSIISSKVKTMIPAHPSASPSEMATIHPIPSPTILQSAARLNW